MKKIKYLFLLTIILPIMCLFCACSDNGLKEGEVYEKEFREAYTTVMPITTMIYNGTSCIPIITMYVRSYPDRWVIKIRAYNKDKDDFDYAEFFVKENCYNEVQIGDWFVFDSENCYDSEPYTQERE